jgi:serine/threonine-protein kinase
VYVGYPLGLALAGSGTLYIADEKGPCVWKLDLVGKRISCAARDRRLRAPVDVAVGEAGELYIADGASHVVWRVDGRGQLSVFAGRPGEGGFSGDGGPASAAQLSRPRAVCCGPEGQLYISDSGNLRIREVRDGKIETWAGTGGKGNPKEGEDVTRTGLESLTTLKVDEKGRVITCKARGACRIEGTGRKAHWLMGSVPQEDHGVQFAHVAVGAGCLVVADQKHHAVHRVRVG